MGFARVDGRSVMADFDGGEITSNAGGLLLGATDRAIGLVGRPLNGHDNPTADPGRHDHQAHPAWVDQLSRAGAAGDGGACRSAENVGRWREMAYLASSNLAREQLARASGALATERTAAYLELHDLASGAVPTPALRQATDQALADVRAAVDVLPDAAALGASALKDVPRVLQLEDVPRVLEALRRDVDAALAGAGPAYRASEEWFSGLVDLVNAMNSLRFTLLAREHSTDPETAAAFRLRSQASAMYEFLARNRMLLSVLVAGGVPADAERLEAAGRNAAQAELAADLLRDQTGLIAPELRRQIEEIQEDHSSAYRRAERALLRELSAGAWAMNGGQRLVAEAEALQTALESLLSDLFVTSRDRIAEMRGEAARTALSWLALLLLGGVAVAASVKVIDDRIVEPLRRLREAMLRLAEGDLEVTLPEVRGNDETAAMADALRVFKSQSIRRGRLQDERLALHERLRKSYQQLRIDLEAAAAVQATLLPPPARLNGVAFSAFFAPPITSRATPTTCCGGRTAGSTSSRSTWPGMGRRPR
jgi:HAMP domain-containing protein